MSANTRAAKRRKTSSNHTPTAPLPPPSPTVNRPTTRRSLQSRDLPSRPVKSNVKVEQFRLDNADDADDADELGVESSPPAAAKRPSRNRRPSSRAASNATYVDQTVNETSKNSTPRSAKAATSKQTPLKAKPAPSAASTTHNTIATTSISSAKARAQRRRSNHTDNAFNSDDTATPTTSFVATERHPSHTEADTVPLSLDPTITEAFKLVVLDKLAGNRDSALLGLDDERQKVHSLLHQTVTAGEGNSMLIIGSRGSGKSTMVKSLLRELAQEHREHFLVIRLNGFIHTDDKLALREIWRQLGREMDVEEEEGQAHNYADTLAKLLAVLSHPAELSSDADPEKVAKSVIFVLDEFDLFASHPRQTLLYNLFDVAQSRKAPIAVLGLTTRVDIADSLEKRVKSRFSHRYVHLSTAKSFDVFVEICCSRLKIELGDLTLDERLEFSKPPETLGEKAKKQAMQKQSSTSTLLTSWNDSVDILLENPHLSKHLAGIYHTTRSIPTALTSLMLPISRLSTPAATDMNLTLLSTTRQPDSKLYLLSSLPTLALALLIAAARLDIILDTDLCNFNMAYDEYVAQTAKARMAASAAVSSVSAVAGLGGKVWSRQAARAMWEKLAQLELLVPAAGGRAAIDAVVVVITDTDMVKCDVALEEIEGAVPDLDSGLVKWCREI